MQKVRKRHVSCVGKVWHVYMQHVPLVWCVNVQDRLCIGYCSLSWYLIEIFQNAKVNQRNRRSWNWLLECSMNWSEVQPSKMEAFAWSFILALGGDKRSMHCIYNLPTCVECIQIYLCRCRRRYNSVNGIVIFFPDLGLERESLLIRTDWIQLPPIRLQRLRSLPCQFVIAEPETYQVSPGKCDNLSWANVPGKSESKLWQKALTSSRDCRGNYLGRAEDRDYWYTEYLPCGS